MNSQRNANVQNGRTVYAGNQVLIMQPVPKQRTVTSEAISRPRY